MTIKGGCGEEPLNSGLTSDLQMKAFESLMTVTDLWNWISCVCSNVFRSSEKSWMRTWWLARRTESARRSGVSSCIRGLQRDLALRECVFIVLRKDVGLSPRLRTSHNSVRLVVTASFDDTAWWRSWSRIACSCALPARSGSFQRTLPLWTEAARVLNAMNEHWP